MVVDSELMIDKSLVLVGNGEERDSRTVAENDSHTPNLSELED